MAYGVKVFRLICQICKDAGKADPSFLASRKNAKACLIHREEWQRRYYRLRYRTKYVPKQTTSRIARARKTWFVGEHACKVPGCGYSKLTRNVKIMEAEGKELMEVKLCPKHLYELNCGFIEAWSWIEKDREKERQERRKLIETVPETSKPEAPKAQEAPDASK